jgi:hypothetical protein
MDNMDATCIDGTHTGHLSIRWKGRFSAVMQTCTVKIQAQGSRSFANMESWYDYNMEDMFNTETWDSH